MQTVTISLNGREAAGLPGTTILDLARQVGVEIPTLCHHPLLKSAGACRVCLVEDMRTGRLLASCVTPITEGMEIQTNSPASFRARRGVLELILSDHPSACVVCSKGNQCVLRSLAKDHGICDPELDPIRRWRPMEEVNPFIVRDLTKCVLCGRCIRVCRDFEAVGAVDYMERGYGSHPGTAERTPLEGSECNFCGSCVAICPTDALAERDRISLSSGRERSPGICSYCGTGCHLEYELVAGAVVGARGVSGAAVNSLSLCVRGHYGQDALASSARLTDPLVRNDDGTFRKVSWDEALGEVARRLKETVAFHGPASIGIIAGTNCSNEELYLASRFARSVLKTPNIDTTARFTSAVVMDALGASLKGMQPIGPLDRLLEADTIVMIGARPDYTHPVVARNIRRAVRYRGASLVQLDPLTTTLSRFAAVHLKYDLGRQPGVLVQLMKEQVSLGLHDEEFLRNHVVNPEDLLAGLRRAPTDEFASPEIKEAAKRLGRTKRTMFVIGSRVARATQGYILTRLVADLALLNGQPQNILFLFEGANEAGAWEIGCSPERLPGGPHSEGSQGMYALENVWGAAFSTARGLDAMDMIRAAEHGRIKALLLLGVDPLAVLPDTERTRNALGAADLVVRTGMFPAVTAETAHVVLPTAAITEMDGSYVNIEGRVQRVSKMNDPPENARPTARFLLDLAGRLEAPMGFIMARDIFDEIRVVCHGWNSLTWGEIGRPGGVAVKTISHRGEVENLVQGEPRLVPYAPPDSLPARRLAPDGRSWRLYTEEQIAHPGDGVVSSRSHRLSRFAGGPSVRMNPQDAERIGTPSGTWALLRSEVGEVRARIVTDSAVPLSGVVIPSGGPSHMLQRLLPWPEEYCPPGWDRNFISVTRSEE